jgi:hypothetical protein
MGPVIIERAADNSVAIRLDYVSVKDERIVCDMFVIGDDCPEGEKVSEPIEKSLNPILHIGTQPKHLLVIVCEDPRDVDRYSNLLSQVRSY